MIQQRSAFLKLKQTLFTFTRHIYRGSRKEKHKCKK